MDARSKGEKVLRELRFDFQTFTIERFIRFVSEAKGRAVITIPWKMPSTLFGAWLSDEDEPNEYIFYRRNVPLTHQIHIQLHEISHFLFGHPTLKINQKLIADVLANRASLPFAELPRLRSTEKNDIETEAEILADLIQKRVIQHSQLGQLTRFSSEGTLADFLKTLGGI
jgi:hypothetical protein